MKSAKLCSSPKAPTTLGPRTHLHGSPDLAVEQKKEGEHDKEADREQRRINSD